MARRRTRPPIDTSTAPGHPAYKLGLTGGSYRAYARGQVPLALAERSPGGIQRAAASMTRQAYAPARAALNTQEQRVKDLQTKRDADNAAFANWVQSRGDQLRAEGIAQANATRERLAQGQSEFATQLTNIRDSANANLARQGVNQPIGGADAAQLTAHESAGQASTLAASNAAQAHVGQSTQTLDATLANNAAVVAASRAKDLADILDQIKGLGDSRLKLGLSEGADHARNVSNMLQQEITKAQALIAASNFTNKLTQTATDKAADRANRVKTTKISSGATRQNAKDKAAAKLKEVNKYGRTNEHWQSLTDSQRQGIIERFDKKAGKGQPSPAASQKAEAKAQQIVSNTINIAKGLRPPASKNPPPRPGVGPNGNVTALAQWLIRDGAPEAVANYAAWAIGNPGKPQPKNNVAQYKKYVKSLLGAR
jgi:hypothetical protein